MYNFYVKLAGKQFGPLSARELSTMELTSDTLVKEASMGEEWLPSEKFDFKQMAQIELKEEDSENQDFDKNNNKIQPKPTMSDSELNLLRAVSIIVGIVGLGTAILNWVGVIDTNKVFGIFPIAACGYICKLINDHCEKCGRSLF